MQAHKIELLVLDFEDSGIKDIIHELERTRYFTSEVMSVQTRDIVWSDNHPLNDPKTSQAAYQKLFEAGANQ